MTDLRTQMADATEAALADILGPAETILSGLDDILDPELVTEAGHVRTTLGYFRQKASVWLAARQAANEPAQP